MGKRKIKKQYRYLCLCEGECQEIIYLKYLQTLLQAEGHNVVFETRHINIKPAALQAAYVTGKSQDVAVLFDYDGDDENFKRMIQACVCRNSYDREFYHAYSNRCFDLWLLLHKMDFSVRITNNDDYRKHFKSAYELTSNDIGSRNFKSEKVQEKLNKRIILSDVIDAIHRAEIIRHNHETSQSNVLYRSDKRNEKTYVYTENPDLMIHEFIKEVFRQCGIVRA